MPTSSHAYAIPSPVVVATNLPCFTPLVPMSSRGEAPDLSGLTSQYDDLEAVVRVEVDVQRGDDLLVVGVLVLGELVGKIGRVVVVDERHGADRLVLADLPLLFDERVSNEVADRLGAVHVALIGDEGVEALEQALVC